MAGNALLLTMIVRVHFWLGQLPDSRLRLYEVASNSLVHEWSATAGLPDDTSLRDKLDFLSSLAFSMQDEAAPEKLRDDGHTLQLPISKIRDQLQTYLKRRRLEPKSLDPLLDRLRDRDAILARFSAESYGFIHRSFQEYFAARHLAYKLGVNQIRKRLHRDGWQETLHMAVAQLQSERREALLDLLRDGEVEFARECLRVSDGEDAWLGDLIRFLAKCTQTGRDDSGLDARTCLEDPEGREAILDVLEAIFDRERRKGPALAAAVELAEAMRGDSRIDRLLDSFFGEAAACFIEDMVAIPAGTYEFGEPGRPSRFRSLPTASIAIPSPTSSSK